MNYCGLIRPILGHLDLFGCDFKETCYLGIQNVSPFQGTTKKGADKETENNARNYSLPDPLATTLLKALATVLQCFATASPEEKEVATLVQRMVDLIG